MGALLQSVSKGFKVALIDCLAEDLSHQQVHRIELLNPKIILFVVYGQM